jgi:DNA-binding LacI/PurR family transcriptional regulator
VSELKLEDIAKKVGVSRSTVSCVVNDYHYAGDDIRKRIFGMTQNADGRSGETARTLLTIFISCRASQEE